MRSRSFYDAAVRSLCLQRGDALGHARSALLEDPGFVAAHQLEAWLLLCSRDARDFAGASRAHSRAAGLPMSARERRHAEAIATAAGGDYARASAMLTEIVREEPRDLVALLAGQVFDHLLGNPGALLARSKLAARGWSEADPGAHVVLALQAFALQECGEYGAAEEAGRRALELEPMDLRAHHAVAHVLEMQGRAEEGVRWMGARSAYWTGTGAGATHIWWHVGLHQLELGREALALELYDRRLRGESLPELIDASALLWRLHLRGHALGERWDGLAARWAPYAADAHCAFNDLHAMMAFVGAGRQDCARRLLLAQEARIRQRAIGVNRDMTRLVGFPACRALEAFGREDFGTAESLLRALPPVAHRLGGSHAQRDVLALTHAEARQRRGVRRVRVAA